MSNLAGCWTKLTKGQRETVLSVLNGYSDFEFGMNNVILASANDAVACLHKYKQRLRRLRDGTRVLSDEKRHYDYLIRRMQNIISKVQTCQTSSNTGSISRRRIRN